MNTEECWYKGVCTNTCSESCLRLLEMSYLVDNSGIPKAKQKPISLIATDEDYEAFTYLAQVKDNIVEWVKQARDIYITSKYTGNGKTSWAIKLLLKYFDSIWAGNGFRVRGLFVHVPTLLLQLKDFSNPVSADFKQNLINADLVVWDDIASTELSNYDYSQLLMYIDQRVMNEHMNIYTGNLDSKQAIEKALGQKLASRIWENSDIFKFGSPDKRGEN